MQNIEDTVRRFMVAADQEAPAYPALTDTAKLYLGDPSTMDPSDLSTCGLVGEEIQELLRAWKQLDDVETFDGALDAIWTLVAFLIAVGFPVSLGWHEVADTNIAKIDPATGKVLKREDGKVLKPQGWKPPDLRRVLNDYGFRAVAAANHGGV